MVVSAFMGTWDKIYPACPKISDRYKFFASGWGDKQRGDKAMSDFRDWVLLGKYHNSELRNSIKLEGNEGSFPSPLAKYLPAVSTTARFRLLLPAGGKPKGVVILFPGIGDQTFIFRRVMLSKYLLRSNIAVVLIVAPMYQNRRPPDQLLHFVATVELLLLQTVALVAEALLILSWLKHDAYPSALLGVAGLSWGGTCAACCGAMWDGPIAISSFIASASFDPLLEGALDGDINWNALTSDPSDPEEVERARRRLREEFDAFSFERICEDAAEGAKSGDTRTLRLLAGPKAALHFGAEHDHFVSMRLTEQLHRLMQQLVPQAQFVRISGGHVSTFIFAPLMGRRIAHAFDVLEASLAKSEGQAAPAVRSRL